MSLSSLFSKNKSVDSPDFAFPKTVSKEASADLKEALKNDDPHKTLNALIRYTLAEELIDQESLQESIEKTEEYTNKFESSDLAPVFYALQARMYLAYYQMDQWKYNSRQLPLTPYPKDLSEWSGEQFRTRIVEKTQKSVSLAQRAKDLKTKDYSDLIVANELTLTYYPSVADFIYSNAIDIYDELNVISPNLIQQAYDMQTDKSSAPALLWLQKKLNAQDAKASEFKTEYLNYPDNQYAGILLESYCKHIERGSTYPYSYAEAVDDDNNTQYYADLKWAIDEIDSFAKSFPKASMLNQLLNMRKSFTQKKVRINFAANIAPKKEFEATLHSENANSCHVAIYYMSDETFQNNQERNGIEKTLNASKPIRTLDVKFPQEIPFSADTTLRIKIDKPGYYFLVPYLDYVKIDNSLSYAHAINAFPVAIDGVNAAVLNVVDPANGAPMSGVNVTLKNKKKNINIGNTDSTGFIDASKLIAPQENFSSVLTYKGIKQYFSVAPSYSRSNIASENLNITILTNRSIYHPGENVEFLAVARQSQLKQNKDFSANVVKDAKLLIVFLNANYESIDTIEGTTDEFGRLSGKFEIPTGGLTGQFRLKAYISNKYSESGVASITVSDYKMPDFELNVTSLQRNVPSEGAVTISGQALTYSGFPVANAKITAILSEANWWRWFAPAEMIKDYELTTDANGNFSLVVEKSVIMDDENTFRPYFFVQFDAVSPTGTTASASKGFSFGKQYQIQIEDIYAPVNGKDPFTPKATAYDCDGAVADIPLHWQLMLDKDIIASGKVGESIDIKNVKPGSYTLWVKPTDETLTDSVSQSIVIYNPSTKISPSDNPLWLLQSNLNIKPDKQGRMQAEILAATPEDVQWMYYAVSDYNTLEATKAVKCKKGYTNLCIELPDTFPGGKVTFWAVKDCKTYEAEVRLTLAKETGLKIECESFRDRLTPTATESWKFKIVDAKGQPVSAALALDMYNKALDAIMPHSFYMSAMSQYVSSWLRLDYVYNRTNYNNVSSALRLTSTNDLVAPEFQFYGYDLNPRRFRAVRNYAAAKYSLASNSDVVECAKLCYDEECVDALPAPTGMNEIANDAGGADQSAEEKQNEKFDFREAEVPMAIWAPKLSTDENGNVCYSFEVPNANTTWILKAVSWTQNLEVGALMREFIASKPVMVQPNAPKFLRAGDKAAVSALVMNNSDSDAQISTTIEFFNPISGEIISTQTFENDVKANSSATVSADIAALASYNAIGYRVRSSNGKFSDGEQGAFNVLPSMASLIETEPFYLNPGDTEYSTTLPKAKDARISLTFSENPAWSIVSALPGLRKEVRTDANSAMAAIFSAAIAQGIIADNPKIGEALKYWSENPSDSVLVSMLEKNEDLKQAVLNCTPWVQAAQSDTERMANLAMIFDNKETQAAINEGIEMLVKLQRGDGGWAWCEWIDESSLWVTSNVLDGIATLISLNWLPNDEKLSSAIERAVKYYDKKVYKKKERETDVLYAIIRHNFKNVPISEGGKKSISNTIADITKHWKEYTDPAYKALAAEALFVNGKVKEANELMESISQFGVWTKNQGLRFPSVTDLFSYAGILDAFALIQPQSKCVDGLRQQLIVRKQGTDWGQAVVTSEVVTAILRSGSNWTIDAQGATVTANGTRIETQNAIDKYTGNIRADLSAYSGKQLVVTTSGLTPAYGAVYAQFSQKMTDVKAVSVDDLSIEKQIFVRNGIKWEHPGKTLQVGDRVKVQLTIKSKRNLSYVTIIDERAATYTPVDQVPGWIWSEGVGFYRENRDSNTNLFVSYMSPGTYLLTYEMDVTYPGQFSSGVATIQSQYAPEISAHSAGATLTVVPQTETK